MANKKKVTTTVTTTVTEENIVSNEKTHIICILDSSGSMSSIMEESISGFNIFLKEQKELSDEATITVALFDSGYELLYENVDIKEAEELTNQVWYPKGMTALYDAVGKTINKEKANIKKLGAEAPAKVLCVIVTDGLENRSREYKIADIKKLISDTEKDNWNFMYLAANQDAFEVGQGFGVSGGNTYTYNATADGVANMSNTLSKSSMNYRSMNTGDVSFSSNSKSLIDDDLNNLVGGNHSTITTDIKYGGDNTPNDE